MSLHMTALQSMLFPDIEDADPSLQPQPSKIEVLTRAQAHIQELESERSRLQAETDALRQQVLDMQPLIQCDDCPVMRYYVALRSNEGGW
jgi:hypothetical protein